jgi:hypothetical protein
VWRLGGGLSNEGKGEQIKTSKRERRERGLLERNKNSGRRIANLQ